MKPLHLLLIAALLSSCATVKKNGYWQTRRYDFGKHIVKEIRGKKSHTATPAVQVLQEEDCILPAHTLEFPMDPPEFSKRFLSIPAIDLPIEIPTWKQADIPAFEQIKALISMDFERTSLPRSVASALPAREHMGSTGQIIIGVILILLGLFLLLLDMSVRTFAIAITFATQPDPGPTAMFFFGILIGIFGLVLLIVGIANAGSGY